MERIRSAIDRNGRGEERGEDDKRQGAEEQGNWQKTTKRARRRRKQKEKGEAPSREREGKREEKKKTIQTCLENAILANDRRSDLLVNSTLETNVIGRTCGAQN